MNEDLTGVSKSINRLATAMWVIAVVMVFNLIFSLFPLAFPSFYMDRFSSVSKIEAPSSGISEMEHGAPQVFSQEKPFHELPIEEQIEESSFIAAARYEKSKDGEMKAIITDILKKDPGVVSYYDVGDEYPSSSYYPDGKSSRGDGVIIFFVGSPADMRMSMSYEGERIRGLGDMPLSLFKDMCNEK